MNKYHADTFDTWISNGMNAGMEYLARYAEIRRDPRLLHPGTKTVISFALPYAPKTQNSFIASYALGPDYHDVMRRLLKEMGIEGRICVDTAPILEKYWAWQCGLGWIGRNHQLVIPQHGSAFFLGEILSEEEADQYDTPHPGSCGDCHLCQNSCPTQALRSDGTLDAARCLSYITIEHRGEITIPPPEGKMFYGCDRCLRACPHHKGAVTQTHFPSKVPDLNEQEWIELTEERYREIFSGSAVKRAKYSGLMRNIQWMLCK